MRRTLAISTVAVTCMALLGLSGCSAPSDPEPQTTAAISESPSMENMEEETVNPVETEVSESVSPAEETPAADLSLANACLSLVEPLQDANLAMLKVAETTANDPQSAVDVWRAFSVAFEDFGTTAANPEVAALSTAVGENGHALTDVMEKVYVESDVSAMGDFTDANDAFFKSYQELLNLCGTTE